MPKSANEVTLLDRLVEAFPEEITYLSTAPIELRIDDRNSEDSCYNFGEITLKVLDLEADRFTLTLDNVPFDDEVKAVAAELEGNWNSTRTGERLPLSLSASQTADLRRLAAAIRKVVGRGRRYLDSNWKWIAPRTARSLEQFARAMSKGT